MVAWLDAVTGWPAFRIAVSLDLHTEATSALRLGRIDPDDCGGSLAAVVGGADGASPRSPQMAELVRVAFCGWAPHTHWLHPAEVREAAATTLAVSLRLDADQEALGAPEHASERQASQEGSGTCTDGVLLAPAQGLWLSLELWLAVLSFLTRRSWRV